VAGERGSIYAEQARLLERRAYPDEQFVCRLASPLCARHAQPGQFVHLRCEEHIPMRRPLSIQRADADAGWIELLFKTHGHGLRALSRHDPGAAVDLLGPIGNGFPAPAAGTLPVLLGGGVGIPPLLFLAERLAAAGGPHPVAFFGSELPFPFELLDSRLPLPGAAAAASIADLERIGVAGRLASAAGQPGCFEGFVTELAAGWLATLPAERLRQCVIYACGPEPMLAAAQALARRHGLASWLCLEEYMACGVGGCAGCTVPLLIDGRPAMKRVCVDGPVFPGPAVYPAAGA